MKILLLTTHLNIGGISFYTVNLAKYLRRKGIEVAVVSSGGNLEKKLKEVRVPHITMDIKTKFEFGAKVIKAIPLLADLVKKEGFQIVHAQTRVTQVLACLVSRFTSVPVVSTCHGFYEYKRLSRQFFPCWGERVISISRSVQEHLLKDFRLSPERIKVVYNGIELDRFSKGVNKNYSLIKEMGLPPDATVVGAVGRLSPVKGFNCLIKAFEKVVVKDTDVRLIIVGEGREKPVLQKQVSEAGLSNKVLFIPGHGPLEEYLAVMDIFCLPSLSEGLGLALMEAMAAGRPCIASCTGGMQEIIEHEVNGFLVPPGDAEAISSAINRLISDNAFRQLLSENARKKAAESFSIEDSVERTIRVYEEVISMHKRTNK